MKRLAPPVFALALACCSSSSSVTPKPAGDSSTDVLEVSPPDADDEADATPRCTAKVNKGPWSLAVDETSAKIRWESCVPGSSGLTLTPEGGGPSMKFASKTTEAIITDTDEAPLLGDADFAGTYTMHEVALTGLKASTCYAYVLDADSTAKGRVCAARAPGDSFSFIALGDTNPGLHATGTMIADAYASHPDFTIHGGDIQYWSSGLETYQSWMEEMRPMLRAGAFFTSIGNHESERPNEYKNYVQRFFGGAGFDGSEYYRFESGGVWFFSIDTEQDVGKSSPQGAWLQAELLDASKKPGFRFSVVFFHRPWVTCGDTGDDKTSRDAYAPIFESVGVKLVVQAHMHGYERFEIGGLTYVTAAGGGGALGNVDENITREECAFRKVSGAFYNTVRFDVKPGQLIGTATDNHGVVRDSFTKIVP